MSIRSNPIASSILGLLTVALGGLMGSYLLWDSARAFPDQEKVVQISLGVTSTSESTIPPAGTERKATVLGQTTEEGSPPTEKVSESQNDDPATWFRLLYLAAFSSANEFPAQSAFSRDDKIVLVVRTSEKLPENKDFSVRVMRGSKVISDIGLLEILDGEIAIPNPERNGDYKVEIEIAGDSIESLPFRVGT